MNDGMIVALERWEKSFREMNAKWKELEEQSVSEQIERWENEFGRFESRQQELRTCGQWFSGPADLLSVIGRSRRETYHSAVLAWLLDPGAPHGLAGKFLGRVIAHCFPKLKVDLSTLMGTVTECEVARHRSRADIVIWCPDVTVVIEVKVDHVERANQCLDLYRDFHLEPDSHFIFLTPTGQKPKTATGDSETAFRSLSFGAIRDILRSLCDEANDNNSLPSGWQTMLCYLQTLEVEFP